MYSLLRPLLFRYSAEQAHHLTNRLFGFAQGVPIVSQLLNSSLRYSHPSLERQLWGLTFPNPVGLAAGFDKDGKYIKTMSKLGFGFIEVGTVTPLAQAGNPQPRLFRLIPDRAVINRMGFNNDGVDSLVANLKKLPAQRDYIIGGNIGKNKVTPNAEAWRDYLICFQKLYDYVDYFVVNLSSPNTPGLRELQDKEPLRKILSTLLTEREQHEIQRPILLKIAPDLTDGQIDDVVEICEELDIEGLIATNTTIDRSGLSTSQETIESIGNGGLSGRPVYERSNQVVRYIHDKAPDLPIIGVGGIESPETAQGKINAGASLIQVYSGMIYAGPYLVKQIKKALVG